MNVHIAVFLIGFSIGIWTSSYFSNKVQISNLEKVRAIETAHIQKVDRLRSEYEQKLANLNNTIIDMRKLGGVQYSTCPTRGVSSKNNSSRTITYREEELSRRLQESLGILKDCQKEVTRCNELRELLR
ncbi:MAG: hypothetical protein IIW92_12605 [Lachnospiraceae bacterium]|nr:hypothetical protein [Lachnospiraceae bacterium]MBQ5919395.1 hypothetical protein [Lachnospiraceae bacterium]